MVKHPQVKFVLSAVGAPPKHFAETLHGHGIQVGAMASSAEHALKHVQASVDFDRGARERAHRHHFVDSIAPIPVLAPRRRDSAVPARPAAAQTSA